MYELFEKLPSEKKKKILDICIEEFGNNGYVSTSTNTIVKRADISKGTLFNYFGNKKNLFLYVLDYTTDYYVNYLIKRMKVNSSDFFQRIVDWAELKMTVSIEKPAIYNFFLVAYLNIPEQLKSDIAVRYQKLYEKGMFLSLDGIDMSKFRDDIDKEKAIELLLITFTGLTEKYSGEIISSEDKGYNSLNERFEVLKSYVSILKTVFYK